MIKDWVKIFKATVRKTNLLMSFIIISECHKFWDAVTFILRTKAAATPERVIKSFETNVISFQHTQISFFLGMTAKLEMLGTDIFLLFYGLCTPSLACLH